MSLPPLLLVGCGRMGSAMLSGWREQGLAASVAVDPASLGRMPVTAHAGTFIGVETDVFVFARGEARPALERHDVGSSADFDLSSNTWSTERDGVPEPGTKYVVEMQLVLFETDVAPAPKWDPHAGNFRPLWTQTLRQAEE